MSTFTELRDDIKEELWRSDLPNSVVDRHIHNAIRQIERSRDDWWFLETFVTIAATSKSVLEAADGVPTDMDKIYSFSVIENSNVTVILEQQPFGVIRELQSSLTSGFPRAFAWTKNQKDAGEIHLDVVPNIAYSYELLYRRRTATPKDFVGISPDPTTSYLTDNYADVLLDLACMTISAGWLKNEKQAARFAAQYKLKYEMLVDEDGDRRVDRNSGNVMPDTTLHNAAFGNR